MSLISNSLIRRLSIVFSLGALLLISSFSAAIAASDSESEAEAGCPYANKKLGKAKCERFGDTSVLRFDTVGKPKAHIVCVHGLGLCAKAYIPFAERMAAAGYRTCSIDVKGFGAGRRAYGQKLALEDSIAEIKELLTYIREHEPDTKTYLLGESMGGAITIAVAARYPELVDGIICSAPAWKVYKKRRTTAKGLVDLVMTKPGPAAKAVMRQATTDSSLRAHWRKDHDHTLDLSAGEILSFMRFIAKTPRRASRVEVPVLLIHGLKDHLIKPEGTARLYQKIASQKKCLLMLDSGEHLILEEGQFDDATVAAIQRWITDCSCPVPDSKHTNAVVIINTNKLGEEERDRLDRIFQLAGVDQYEVEEFNDINSGGNRKLMVVNCGKKNSKNSTDDYESEGESESDRDSENETEN